MKSHFWTSSQRNFLLAQISIKVSRRFVGLANAFCEVVSLNSYIKLYLNCPSGKKYYLHQLLLYV